MMHWIRNVAEPTKLILAWQAPDQFGPANRTRWAVGLLERTQTAVTFRYLNDSEFAQANLDRPRSDLISFGYLGYPAFRQVETVYEHGVEEIFRRRLPPRSRPDFADYLRLYRIPPDTSFSDFALLGTTEGKLPSDGFSLVDPLNPELSKCDLLLEVAGYRYYKGKLDPQLSVGDSLKIVEDPDKTHEPHAVAVYSRDRKIGNINRLQAPTFIKWMKVGREISAVVERLNGTAERPRAHIFVSVRPS